MPTTADDPIKLELLYEVLYILKEGSEGERARAVKMQVPKLRDVAQARVQILELLTYGDKEDPEGKDRKFSQVKSWASTALDELCGKDDEVAQEIIVQLGKERYDSARYWMLLSLYHLGDQAVIEDTVREIARIPAQGDVPSNSEVMSDYRVAPLALVILASWGDSGAIVALENLLKSENVDHVFWTCRALRDASSREVLELLGQLAKNPEMWPHIRQRAAIAIARIESPAAARLLAQVLEGESDALLKESAIDGLEALAKKPQVREALYRLQEEGESQYAVADSLMAVLLDRNAQVRQRAAAALPWVMQDPRADDDQARAGARAAAARKVVDELVRESVDQETDVPLLVHALREIDPPEAEAAAVALRQYIDSEDLSVRQRAEDALRLLGGERAVQTLMRQKTEVLQAYNELLAEADKPIQELFKQTMKQAQRSFSISQGMSVAIFVVGIIALAASLYVAFSAGNTGLQFVFGAGTSIVAVIAIVLDMLLLDPHKRVQEAMSVLLRIKVIFHGYLRQIHQIDATFRHEFIKGGQEFGVKQIQETISQVSGVMGDAMELITVHLPVRKADGLTPAQAPVKWQEWVQAALKAVGEQEGSPTEELSQE